MLTTRARMPRTFWPAAYPGHEHARTTAAILARLKARQHWPEDAAKNWTVCMDMQLLVVHQLDLDWPGAGPRHFGPLYIATVLGYAFQKETDSPGLTTFRSGD